MSRFVGITRERVFSPGKIDDDAAVLETVAARLRELGHAVSVLGGDAPQWPEPDGAAAVFAMCQGAVALERLHAWEGRGVRIVNRPQAILNCQRHRTIARLNAAGVPFPQSVLVDTGEQAVVPAWVDRGAWLKRGDVHATEAGDVARVDGVEAAQATLRGFRARGIRNAVIQQHVRGTVLKFYGVSDSFFYCVQPPSGPPIPSHVLAEMAALGQRAARALQLEIYGGDCVYDEQRQTLALIDLNDWPSYAPCRAEAATYIAAYLHARDVASGW